MSFISILSRLHLTIQLLTLPAVQLLTSLKTQMTLLTEHLVTLLYIVLTISILIGQEPSAYFENPRDFVDKHDYFMIVRIVKVWNNLPLHVVEAESFEFLS